MKQAGIMQRMKENYENRSRHYLNRRTPVVIRIDGRAFHTLTKNLNTPFSGLMEKAMNAAAFELCHQAQGIICAYVQSDEISLVLKDYDRFESQAWFDYNIQKLTSVSASIATIAFYTQAVECGFPELKPTFDARAFNIPESEVTNYLIARQQDWIRNSILMVGQAHFSHKELMNKGVVEIKEMLASAHGISWDSIESKYRLGRTFLRRPYNGMHDFAINEGFDFIKLRDVIDTLVMEKED